MNPLITQLLILDEFVEAGKALNLKNDYQVT